MTGADEMGSMAFLGFTVSMAILGVLLIGGVLRWMDRR